MIDFQVTLNVHLSLFIAYASLFLRAGFYTSLAAVRMRSRETINIVGSFAAIAQAVQVAETLKSRGDAVITKIETGYGPSAGFAKGVPAQKPEIHITVKRTPEFESKMAEVEKKLLQQAEEEKLRQQANE